MSDLVGNPEDRFSRVAAQIIHYDGRKQSQLKFVLDVKQTHLVL